MKITELEEKRIRQLIRWALEEDIGEGDHSTLSTVPVNLEAKAKMIAKESGILVGIAIADMILEEYDATIRLESQLADGSKVAAGDLVLTMEGNAQQILSLERLILNIMQRMSGIARATHKMVDLIAHTDAVLIDTRKTTPNFRVLEKMAVRMGGGQNHRFGLYDMVMLKDNHIDYAGSIQKAVQKARNYIDEKGLSLKIEVETRNLYEVEQALASGADIIMLDNMDTETMSKAVGMIDGKAGTEASGGITRETIASIAETGVDFISVGALTHSYRSLDLSLKADL